MSRKHSSTHPADANNKYDSSGNKNTRHGRDCGADMDRDGIEK